MIEARLDAETRKMWESRFIDIKRNEANQADSEEDPQAMLPMWDDMKDFLEDRCRILRHATKPSQKIQAQANIEKLKLKQTKSYKIFCHKPNNECGLQRLL